MIPAEAAHNTITALGEVGMLQFKDLNADKSAFQRTYANQIKRCDEMARQVRFFQEELRKANVPAASLLPSDRAFDFDRMEGELLQLESELSQLTSNSERLRRSHNELLELQLVLERAAVFFSDARSDALATREDDEGRRGLGEGPALSDIGAPLLESASAAPEASKGVQLGFVAGTVLTDRLAAFERLLFRATRGNVYLRSAGVGSVEDPSTGERHDKAVYVVFFSGERARAKVSKAAEAFGAARYPFPEDRAAQR
ncbi:V-type ATPase, partial [Helicosporidium sp. ATCC 50920]